MVDPQKARHLLSLYRRYRGYLEELGRRTDAELRGDFAVMGGLRHYLLLAIETVMDLGSHVISSEGFEMPDSYADIATCSSTSMRRWTRSGGRLPGRRRSRFQSPRPVHPCTMLH